MQDSGDGEKDKKRLRIVRRKSGVTLQDAEDAREEISARFETPMKLLQQIQKDEAASGVESPLRKYLKLLTAGQRRQCVMELVITGGMRRSECAELFGVSPERIRQDCNAILKSMGLELKDFKAQEFIAWVRHHAEITVSRLTRNGQHHAAWTVVRDLANLFMQFGMVQALPRPADDASLSEEERALLLREWTDAELQELDDVVRRAMGGKGA
jgi:hypothetical protein